MDQVFTPPSRAEFRRGYRGWMSLMLSDGRVFHDIGLRQTANGVVNDYSRLVGERGPVPEWESDWPEEEPRAVRPTRRRRRTRHPDRPTAGLSMRPGTQARARSVNPNHGGHIVSHAQSTSHRKVPAKRGNLAFTDTSFRVNPRKRRPGKPYVLGWFSGTVNGCLRLENVPYVANEGRGGRLTAPAGKDLELGIRALDRASRKQLDDAVVFAEFDAILGKRA